MLPHYSGCQYRQPFKLCSRQNLIWRLATIHSASYHHGRTTPLPPLLFFTFILVSRSTPPPRQHAATSDPGLHPVVLLPGSTCSQLEARLTDSYELPSPHCSAGKGNNRE